MAWEPIAPHVAAPSAQHVVTLGLLKDGGRYKRVFRLVLRLQDIPDCPGWLHPEHDISVLRGMGPDAGKVRLEHGGPHRVKNLSRHKNGRLALITWPAWPGLSPAAQNLTKVEFDHAPTWFEIDLPGWAMMTKPTTAPAPGLASVLPKSNPFGVPKELRAGRGGV